MQEPQLTATAGGYAYGCASTAASDHPQQCILGNKHGHLPFHEKNSLWLTALPAYNW